MIVFGIFVSACFLLHVVGANPLLEEIIADDRVRVVEFYSAMCGSCTEFAPKWAQLERKLGSVVTSKINIDEKDGMDLAQKIGVLDEGLPNIRLFSSSKADVANKGVSIMPGTEMSPKEIWGKLKDSVKDLTKRDDGFYLKSNS